MQSNKMPSYTKKGYIKMKIPHQLYGLLLEARNESKVAPEECDPLNTNCIRIKANGQIGNVIIFFCPAS